MKKLLTVSKSKFYMLKINYSKIFKDVDFDNMADIQAESEDESEQAENRLYKDLKRSDVDSNGETDARQALINRLKAPINVAETGENLNSPEQIAKRKAILDMDKKNKDGLKL